MRMHCVRCLGVADLCAFDVFHVEMSGICLRCFSFSPSNLQKLIQLTKKRQEWRCQSYTLV